VIPGDAAPSTLGFCAERVCQFRGINFVHPLGGPSDVSLGPVHRTVGRYRWWSVVVPGRPSLSSLKVRLGYHNPVCSDASYAEIPEDFRVLQSKDMLLYSGPCAVRIAGLNCHVCEDRGVMMPFIRGEGGGESPCPRNWEIHHRIRWESKGSRDPWSIVRCGSASG